MLLPRSLFSRLSLSKQRLQPLVRRQLLPPPPLAVATQTRQTLTTTLTIVLTTSFVSNARLRRPIRRAYIRSIRRKTRSRGAARSVETTTTVVIITETIVTVARSAKVLQQLTQRRQLARLYTTSATLTLLPLRATSWLRYTKARRPRCSLRSMLPIAAKAILQNLSALTTFNPSQILLATPSISL